MYIKDFDTDIELDDLQKAIYEQGRLDQIKLENNSFCARCYEVTTKAIREDVIDELYNKIDEGVCDICEHKNFESDCFKTCNFEVENAKKWLLQLKEQERENNE